MVGTDIPGVHNDRTDNVDTVRVITSRDISVTSWLGLMVAIPLAVLIFGGITLWIGGII